MGLETWHQWKCLVIHVDSLTPSTLKELGKMKKLRELRFRCDDLSSELEAAFVELLGKLSNIQILKISYGGVVSMDLLGERWVPPQSLREFIMRFQVTFSTLPAWIRRNPSHPSNLYCLNICVKEMRLEDLGLIGRLPALRSLILWSDCQRRQLVGSNRFPCLTLLKLFSKSPAQIVFQSGALPKMEEFDISIGLRAAKEERAGYGGDWFDLGMGNLPSLRKVYVGFNRSGVTVGEAKQAKAALENALRAHPNRPTFDIGIGPDIPQGT